MEVWGSLLLNPYQFDSCILGHHSARVSWSRPRASRTSTPALVNDGDQRCRRQGVTLRARMLDHRQRPMRRPHSPTELARPAEPIDAAVISAPKSQMSRPQYGNSGILLRVRVFVPSGFSRRSDGSTWRLLRHTDFPQNSNAIARPGLRGQVAQTTGAVTPILHNRTPSPSHRSLRRLSLYASPHPRNFCKPSRRGFHRTSLSFRWNSTTLGYVTLGHRSWFQMTAPPSLSTGVSILGAVCFPNPIWTTQWLDR